MRDTWRVWCMLFTVVLLWAPGRVQGTAKQELFLSAEFNDPSYRKITLIFRNESKAPVKFLSGNYALAGEYIRITTPDGKLVAAPGGFPLSRTPEAKDYITLPPHSSARITRLAAYFEQLDRGKLYFLHVDYPTDVPGKHFTGEFAYGLPVKADGTSGAMGDLRLALQSNESLGSPLAFSLTNESATAVKVPTAEYVLRTVRHGKGMLSLRTTDGTEVIPSGGWNTTPPPAPTEKDTLTLDPRATSPFTLDVAKLYGIERGKLYFLDVTYPDSAPGKRFHALVPYGLPVEVVKPATGLFLSVAYDDPTYKSMTFVFNNSTADTVTLLSPAYEPSWPRAVRVRGADGKPIPQTIFVKAAPATAKDYLTIAPYATARVTTPAMSLYTVEKGKLYFLDATFATNLPGQSFTGTFPYAALPDGVKLDTVKLEKDLRLSVRFTDQTLKTMVLELANDSAQTITVLSSQYTAAISSISGANGKSPTARVKTMPAPPPPTTRDYVTIPPRSTGRVTIDLTSDWVLTRGTPYFLTLRYPATTPAGKSFAGRCPIGLPPAPATR